MLQEFGFGLDESADLARSCLDRHTAADLTFWPDAVAVYRREKHRLIEAINPTTARRVLHIDTTTLGEDQAYEVLFDACSRYDCGGFVNSLICRDAMTDKISIDSAKIISARTSAEIKVGMKLSRAIAAWLAARWKHHTMAEQFCPDSNVGILINRFTAKMRCDDKVARLPTNEELIAIIVEKIEEARKGNTKAGSVVISANIADLILMSEHAAFDTCHRLEGAHRAGPQQYIRDDSTVVAYFYQEVRPYNTAASGSKSKGPLANLPYKLWRILVHMALDRGEAVLMRQYPKETSIPREAMNALKDEIAKLLLGKTEIAWGKDVFWGYGVSFDNVVANHPAEGGPAPLAYVDRRKLLTGTIMKSGVVHVPYVLAKDCHCLSCGKLIDRSASLVCSACVYKCRCIQCKASLKGETKIEYNGNSFCTNCHKKCFRPCAKCNTLVLANDLVKAGSDLGLVSFCNGCFATECFVCCNCRENHVNSGMKKTAKGLWCGGCYRHNHAPCYDCKRMIRKAPPNQRLEDGHIRTICRSCRNKRETASKDNATDDKKLAVPQDIMSKMTMDDAKQRLADILCSIHHDERSRYDRW